MAIRWTQEKIDRLGKLWATKSVKLADIAAEFGIEKNSVRRAVKRFYGNSLPNRAEHKPLVFKTSLAKQMMVEHAAWLRLIKATPNTKQQALMAWLEQADKEEILRHGK